MTDRCLEEEVPSILKRTHPTSSHIIEAIKALAPGPTLVATAYSDTTGVAHPPASCSWRPRSIMAPAHEIVRAFSRIGGETDHQGPRNETEGRNRQITHGRPRYCIVASYA
jgi:hypothetical protein